jgi:hypothetical protein
VFALILSLWTTTREALFSPAGAVFAVVWFLLLGTSTMVLVLRVLSKPREVLVAWNCAYCIAMESVGIGYSKEKPDAMLQVTAGFRNTGNGPIKVKTEEFRATLGDRVAPEAELGEIMIPRISTKGVTSGLFKKDAIPVGSSVINSSLVMVYGRHDEGFSRRFKLKGRVNIIVDEKHELKGVSNEIANESDEPI